MVLRHLRLAQLEDGTVAADIRAAAVLADPAVASITAVLADPAVDFMEVLAALVVVSTGALLPGARAALPSKQLKKRPGRDAWPLFSFPGMFAVRIKPRKPGEISRRAGRILVGIQR
jgi:hypothetical protein